MAPLDPHRRRPGYEAISGGPGVRMGDGARPLRGVTRMPVGLAPLSVGRPDDPDELFDAAVRGGFSGVGMSARHPDGAWARWAEDVGGLPAIRRSAHDHGLDLLDIGIVRLESDLVVDEVRRVIDLAHALEASYLLVQGWDADFGRSTDTLARIAGSAAEAGLVVALEFMPYSAIRNLRSAVDLVEATDVPAAGVLLDLYHLVRSGGSAQEVAELHSHVVLVQVSDGVAVAPPPERLRREALTDRRYPGEGSFPLVELLARIPGHVPLTVETPCLAHASRPRLEQAEILGKATGDLLREAGRLE